MGGFFLPDADAAAIDAALAMEALGGSGRDVFEEYLRGHFRYEGCYANCVKLRRMGLPQDVETAAYDIIDSQEFDEFVEEYLRNFAEQNRYYWQALFSGRMGGYLVLHRGQLKSTGHKSYCRICGQRDFRSVTETGTRCGRCGADARVDFREPPMRAVIFRTSGEANTDFWEMEDDEVREIAQAVRAFDEFCDDMRAEFINICRSYRAAVERAAVC